MIIRDVVDKLALKVLAGEDFLDREVDGGYVADLLSCVIAGAEANVLWVTLQTHANIVAVAALNEIAGIIIAEGAVVPQATLDKAAQQDVVVLSSPDPVYETVGKLIALGV
jgi:serine kinase of HPr protein (carbohydrate metabolism regulator)